MVERDGLIFLWPLTFKWLEMFHVHGSATSSKCGVGDGKETARAVLCNDLRFLLEVVSSACSYLNLLLDI